MTEEWKPSDLSEDINSTTHIVFHAGNTPESYEAFELLDKSKVHFRVVWNDDIKTPFLAWGEASADESFRGEADEGLVYEGVENIKHFIEVDKEMSKNFRKRHPELEGQGDPAFGQWYDNMLEEQKKKNRLVIYKQRQVD